MCVFINYNMKNYSMCSSMMNGNNIHKLQTEDAKITLEDQQDVLVKISLTIYSVCYS